MLQKIISGGQTGADRAALDFAIKHDIPHGGWIPKGRKTEDGILPDKYKLDEMRTASYPKQTEKNILDSDGTLIFSRGKLTGGSALTRRLAKRHDKPWVHIDLDQIGFTDAVLAITVLIEKHNIQTLNVAGPRASKDHLIHDVVVIILEDVFKGEQ